MKGKTITFLVALCFILLAFSPLTTGAEDNLTNSTVEVSMGDQNYNVELTQQEQEQLHQIFTDITTTLNQTLTPYQVEQTVENALIQLDRLGLLQGIGIQQVKNQILQYYRFNRYLPEKIQQIEDDPDTINSFCSILTGTLSENQTSFEVHSSLNYLLGYIERNSMWTYVGFLLDLFMMFIYYYVPLKLHKVISFGYLFSPPAGGGVTYPRGVIVSTGLTSDSITGKIKGNLTHPGIPSIETLFYPGVYSYTGLIVQTTTKVYFMGGTLRTKLHLVDPDMKYGG